MDFIETVTYEKEFKSFQKIQLYGFVKIHLKLSKLVKSVPLVHKKEAYMVIILLNLQIHHKLFNKIKPFMGV